MNTPHKAKPIVQPAMVKALLPLALLLLFFLLSRWLIMPPERVGIEAADTDFSACRAYKHTEAISQLPRPSNSLENDRVRAYLISQLEHLGYEVSLQQTTAYSGKRLPTFGHITNIMASLPGTEGEKAILVVGHHDTQPHTPGAADNGIALSAMLEAAAVFKALPPMKNDLVLLFTDSEEIGLLGARAFVGQHPLLENIGLVINLEARGNTGPALAFEVSPDNGWIMREFMQSAAYPLAASLMYEIYQLLPNDTDFTIFKEAGLSGFNIALIEGYTHYHSATDRPENLNINSLQHMGSYVVSLVSHFGELPLHDTKAENLVYFNYAGFGLLAYPMGWNTGILIVLILLYLGVLFLKCKKGKLGWWNSIIGFLLLLAGLALSIGVVWGVNKLVLMAYPHYAVFYGHTFYNANYYYMAYMLLTAGVFYAFYSLLMRRLSADVLFIPGLTLFFALSVAVLIKLPTASYLFFVPLLAVLAASFLIELLGKRIGKNFWLKGLLWLLFVLPVIFLLGPMVFLVFHTFGLVSVFAGVAMLFYLLYFLFPVLAKSIQAYGLRIAAIWFTGFVVFAGMAHFQSGYDVRQPLQSHVMYASLQEEGKAFWLSRNEQTDSWNRQFFKEPVIESIPEFYPGLSRTYLKSEASFLPMKSPEIAVLSDTLIEGKRQLRFVLSSFHRALMLELIADKSLAIEQFEVNNIATTDLDGIFINWPFQAFRIVNPEGAPTEIFVSFQGNPEFEFSLIERIIGLPQIEGYSPMPPGIIPDTDYESSMQLVKHHFSI